MENKQYKKKSLQEAIQALEDEVLNIRIKRDSSPGERVKESLNNQILSFILCIQHLKDIIGDENE
jgi:hypothetical protein